MLTGMRQDFSWRHSAREYLQLYTQLGRSKRRHQDIEPNTKEAHVRRKRAKRTGSGP
jgi:hypothetical protein